jgi:hypothetical protein
MRQQRLLVAVPEGRGLKLAGLAVENMLGDEAIAAVCRKIDDRLKKQKTTGARR